jgi:hypothetical protein
MVARAEHGSVRDMNRTRLVSGVIALALAAAACGSGDSSDAGATDPPPATLDTVTVDTVTVDTVTGETVPDDTVTGETAADDTSAPSAVPAALQFTAPAVGGGEIDAAQFAGTPTLFWFWAPF